jgi:tetratricopeptide (TPR) repeat protein
VVLIEAEPGLGKSVLLQAARELAISRGAAVHDGAADSIEDATPYFAMRGAVLDLLGVPAGASPALAREIALARIEADAPELAWLAPLLAAIVPIGIEDTVESAQIVGTTRAERLGDLIVALVNAALARGPVVWAIEDLHWADGASWALCRRLVEEARGLLLLGTSRSMPSPPPDREKLIAGEGREVITLADLPALALSEIIAMRLGVADLPADLSALLAARADGNPFFAEELALAAREAGGIVVEGGRVRVARSLETLDLPTSITGVITSRMDRLGTNERGALKCAAVLGRSFDLPTLGALLGDASASDADALVHRLAEATFLEPEPEERSSWRFRHSFVHETAYALSTFAERRALHASAALAIEARDNDLKPVTALLAHHFEIAEVAERAAHYHALAGEQALEADANQECVEHLTKALRFDEIVRGALAVDLVRARWGRMLTEASYSLGQHREARAWGDKMFGWSGLRTPTHAGHVLLNVGQHVWRRFRPAPQADEDTRARYAEACVASSTLQTVAMWSGDRVSQLGLAVYADVVSRACDPSPARAIAQASMAFILAVVGMHDVGIRDAKAAERMSDALGDAPTQIVTKVILGLILSSLGKNLEALPPLAEARRIAERVGSGLWRHRALFQSGEPHFQLGEIAIADDLFERCVAVATKVEPSVAGLSRAMQAACRLRAGKSPDEALALLSAPDGLAFAEPGPTMMALVALGTNAWALLLAERYAEALESAQKCLALVARESDDARAFARAMDGQAPAALVLTRLWELRRDGAAGTGSLPAAPELERDAARAAHGLAKLAARWPAARPIAELVRAYQLRLHGKTRAAARSLERAARDAGVMSQAWERALALRALERYHGRPAPELAQIVERHGLGGVSADYFPL